MGWMPTLRMLLPTAIAFMTWMSVQRTTKTDVTGVTLVLSGTELFWMKWYPKLLLALAFVGLFALLAQPASAQVLEEDEESYVQQQGFFFSVEYGPYFFVARGRLANDNPLRPQANIAGTFGGVQLGYRISPIFSLQFLFLTTQVPGNGQVGGANGSYMFNLSASISFVRINRVFLYAKLGGGLQLTLPEETYGSPLGIGVHGGLGVRWHTRLKHFSIGLEALAVVHLPLTDNGIEVAVGFGLMPTLMYIF